MTLLHTVNKSPFETNSLDTCLSHVLPGSSVLLIEDGVYGALKGTAAAKKIATAGDAGIKIYVLSPDADARGLAGKLADGISTVDYAGFVELATQHKAVQSWL